MGRRVMRTLWLVIGFVGGIAVGRNAVAMPNPVALAVLVFACLTAGFGWWAARRDRVSAVATAVASAVAVADARAEAASLAASEAISAAEARAAAIASQVVQVVLSDGKPVPTIESTSLDSVESVMRDVVEQRSPVSSTPIHPFALNQTSPEISS